MSTLMEVETRHGVSRKEIETTTARTRVESSRSLLKWDIQDFDVLIPNEAEKGLPKSEKDAFFRSFEALRSPIFKTRLGHSETTQSDQKWFVELDVNPKSEANTLDFERYISLHLKYQPSDTCLIEPSRLVVSVHILGRRNVVHHKRCTGTKFVALKAGYLRRYQKYISLKELWEHRKTYLFNNTLRLRVQVAAFGSTVTETTDSIFGCVAFSGSKLLQDMRELFKSGMDTDIMILCGHKAFQVHSVILKGRSFVFQRMLESGMKESEDRIIKIEDVDPIILEAFLDYIYTGQVELNLESMDKAFGLVRIADKYGIEELKAICFRFMYEHMSLKNAGEIAVFSYQHNAGEFVRTEVVSFCHTNWSELAKLSTFKECVSENPLAFF